MSLRWDTPPWRVRGAPRGGAARANRAPRRTHRSHNPTPPTAAPSTRRPGEPGTNVQTAYAATTSSTCCAPGLGRHGDLEPAVGDARVVVLHDLAVEAHRGDVGAARQRVADHERAHGPGGRVDLGRVARPECAARRRRPSRCRRGCWCPARSAPGGTCGTNCELVVVDERPHAELLVDDGQAVP